MNTSLSSLSTIAAINKLLEDCSAGFYVSFQRIFQNGMRDAYILKSNDPGNPASQIAYIDNLLESGINDIPGIASYLIDSYQPIPYDVFTGGFQKEKLIQHVMPRLYSSGQEKRNGRGRNIQHPLYVCLPVGFLLFL